MTGPAVAYALVPLPWLARAMRRTRSLAVVGVGAYCWYLAGCRRTRTDLLVVWREARFELDLGRTGFFRGLRGAEAAGLLRVRRRPRHGCRVTLPSDAELATWDRAPEAEADGDGDRRRPEGREEGIPEEEKQEATRLRVSVLGPTQKTSTRGQENRDTCERPL